MEWEKFRKKNQVSEGVVHERNGDQSAPREVQGYEAHPKDEHLYESFGLHNSFDDMSVGVNADGLFTIAVTSEKEYHSPTLGAARKRLKTNNRKKMYEHYGEMYLNAGSPKDSAYVFRTKMDLTETRILSEFKRSADKRLSRQQREAAPFLTLREDREYLSELRSRDEKSEEEQRDAEQLQTDITQRVHYENRFLRKLRAARAQPLIAPDEKKPAPIQRAWQTDAEADETDEPEENDPPSGKNSPSDSI